MIRTIPPIETKYEGVRFRSRLEARWAIFFDELGVPWEYEPECYRLRDGHELYIPDFRMCGPSFTNSRNSRPSSRKVAVPARFFCRIDPSWDVYGIDNVRRAASVACSERFGAH